MKDLNKDNVEKRETPERIIQFGDGNFLRGFIDWMIQEVNEKTTFNGSVVVVQPRAKRKIDTLLSQDCMYHLNIQGIDGDNKIDYIERIDSISRALNPYQEYEDFIHLAEIPEIRFIISNTTEAGIVFDPNCKLEDKPADSFPGKLVQLLYHRYKTFNGDNKKGFIILPCELIFHNGRMLEEIVHRYIELWQLDSDFKKWVSNACHFYSTLVDRIVPGAPQKDLEQIKERIGFDDKLIVQAETFHLWVIEAPKALEDKLPLQEAGLNVIYTKNESPYHERKVTLLNGPHTVLAPVAFLSGIDIVRDACEDELVGEYIRQVMYEELLPTLDLPKEELIAFADAVMDRFRNPFIDHAVTSIMLNSFSKYKTRDLPGLKKYFQSKGKLPKGLVLGLAAIIIAYKGDSCCDDRKFQPSDNPEILALVQKLWKNDSSENIAKEILGAKFIWEEDLNTIPGLTALLNDYIHTIESKGMYEAIKKMI